MSDRRLAFDPADAFNAMAEAIRNDVCEIAVSLDSRPSWKGVPDDQKLECLVAGMMTGVIGVLICFVQPEDRDDFVAAIAGYVPDAYAAALEIMVNGEGDHASH